jgi:hypothetical protein
MNRISLMDKFGGQYSGSPPTICSRCIEHIEREQRNRDYKNIPHGLSIFQFVNFVQHSKHLPPGRKAESAVCSLMTRMVVSPAITV